MKQQKKMDIDLLKKQEIGRLDNTNNTDLLSNNERNEELVEFHKVDNTPFTIAKQNNVWSVLMGKYLIETGYERKEQAEAEAMSIDWDKLLKVIVVIVEEIKQERNGTE